MGLLPILFWDTADTAVVVHDLIAVVVVVFSADIPFGGGEFKWSDEG
jgi:hypothetical protein